jgi:hypothetical protein
MCNSRPRRNSDSKSSVCLIFECLGSCLSAVAAADEEKKAREAHNRHDHRDEQYHYNNAASYHHNSGNHYAELKDRENAHEAGHEARRESGCSIM